MAHINSGKILHEFERQKVALIARKLQDTRLIVNTSGNVSIRIGNYVAITPSAKDYQLLEPSDICLLDMSGEIVEGKWLPSSETGLHLALYEQSDECQAIVHTHSIHSTAASMLTNELPSIHYQMADLGGAVPVAPYQVFGSPELAKSVTDTIKGHTAALMENHGSISFGPTVEKALSRTVLLEWCSEVWMKAISAGAPNVLTADQVEQAKVQMANYASARSKCECGKH